MISLLHPSRGRAQKAFETAREWISKAGVEVDYILSIDNNDPEYKKYLGNDLFGREGYILHSDNTSVVEATNNAAKAAKGDILLYLSDDFKCFDNWGLAVQKEFEGENRPLLIKVDDCLQKFEVPVLTIPIMNRALYERLGYFWHPGYKSMFVDEDLYWTTRKLGALKNCEHLKFEHQHCSVGKAENDETYRRSAANWDQGKALFAKRRGEGFQV
jgi:hypothetical protein